MPLSQSVAKKCAKILILLMLFMNTAGIPFVQAADSTTAAAATYTADKTNIESAVTSSSATGEHLTNKEKSVQFGNNLLNYYLKAGKNNGPEWLQRTDFEIYFGRDSKPVYSLETLQPLGLLSGQGQQWFWQGRYARQSEGSTANVGFGWRKLAADKKSLVGLNVFYDYGFEYDLARVGVGGEYFNQLAEYRVNWYHPVSDDRLAKVSYQPEGILYSYIRAVEGADFEAGTSFTNVPWLKVFAGGYYWDNKHQDDEVGYRLRSTMQINDRLNVELGYTGSNINNGLYGKLKYQMALDEKPNLKNNRNGNISPVDLSTKLLQKVERENDIKTETYAKFVAYSGSIQTSVINENNNTPIGGATVQAYQNGAAVGSAATTDVNGHAVISGLTVGSYTVYATYANETGTSNPVTVTRDTAAAASVSLDVIGGSATVSVYDASAAAVSGATVVATASNTGIARATGGLWNKVLGIKSAYAGLTSFSVSVKTNSHGVATFTNLPPGNYAFTVTNSSYSMKSETVAVASNTTASTTVVLPASGGNLKVVVKDSTGSAISGASVAAGTAATGTTDSTGSVTLAGITAGSYAVTAALAGYTQSEDRSATINNGETSQVILIMHRQEGTVSISLSGTMSNDGYTVKLTNASDSSQFYSATVSSGTPTATVSNVPIGTYAVTVIAPFGYTTTLNQVSVTVTEGSAATVAITSSHPVGSVQLTLNGYVSSENYTVQLTSTSDSSKTYTGNVRLFYGPAVIDAVPAGSYNVTVTAPDFYNATVNPVSITVTDGVTTTVVVESTRQMGTVNLNLSGSISNQDYAVSIITPKGLTEIINMNAGTTSKTLNLHAAGQYQFSVTAPSGYKATINPASVTVTEGSITTVAIESTQAVGAVSINLSGMMSNGAYTVKLTNASNSSLVFSRTVSSGSTMATVSDVPVGTYTVTVTAPSGYAATANPASINVTDGGTATVAVTSSLAMITVKIVNNYPGVACYIINMETNSFIYAVSTNATGSFSILNGTSIKVLSTSSQVYTITEPCIVTVSASGDVSISYDSNQD